MYLSELSGSPGLLFMPVVCLGNLGNGFPVGDLGWKKFGLYMIGVIQVPFYDVQVMFSLSTVK